MFGLLSLVGRLLAFVPGIADGVLTHLNRRTDAQLEGFKAGTEADTARLRAVIEAHLANNRLKLAQQGWWGAQLIILIAGVPAALHMALIFLDSSFSLGCDRPFGCLGVPKPPPPYDQYERDIVMSFFLVLPAMPVASAAAAWLTRR